MAEGLIWVLFFFSGEYAHTRVVESNYSFHTQAVCNQARDAYNQRIPKRDLYTRAECVPFPATANRK